MRLTIRDTKTEAGAYIADYIAKRINAFKPRPGHPNFVLGCPTGSTPLPVYKRLVELYNDRKVSFKDVITCELLPDGLQLIAVNMDEYVGIPRDHPESYHSFMFKNFFSLVDIE